MRVFDGRVGLDGHYDVKEHIAENVDLFGPFPKALVDQIFDGEGRVRGAEDMARGGLASEDFTPGMSAEALENFEKFLKNLLKIDPAEILDSMGLLRHPWLGAVK